MNNLLCQREQLRPRRKLCTDSDYGAITNLGVSFYFFVAVSSHVSLRKKQWLTRAHSSVETGEYERRSKVGAEKEKRVLMDLLTLLANVTSQWPTSPPMRSTVEETLHFAVFATSQFRGQIFRNTKNRSTLGY